MSVEHSTRAHSKLGASSSERWSECPGSVKLIEQFPPAPTSVYAEEGTAAHELAETVLKSDPGPNAFFYVRKKKFNGFEVTPEMAEHVQSYVDYVRNVKNETGGELLLEHKFHLKHLHPDFYGTCDAVVMEDFGTLHVFDFKYGAGIAVEAENNSQLQFYALGALELGDFENVRIHICQPRAFHADGGFRTWDVSPKALRDFGKFLKSKAIETQKENAPLKQGDWCRWCPAAVGCPEMRKRAIETAQTDFAQPPTLPAPQTLTEEQISKIVQYRKPVTAWLEAVEEYALTRVLQGEKIKGVKLVRSQSRRHWIDLEESEKVLRRNLGENAYTRKLLTVPQAEKALGKDSIVGLFQTVGGGPVIAHESDRRKSVNPNDFAAEEFEVFGDKTEFEVTEDDF